MTNDFTLQALTKALKDIFEPRFLFTLLLIPLAAFVVVLFGILIFWSPLRDFLFHLLNETMFSTAIMWSFQWFVDDPLGIFTFIVGILVFIFALPFGFILITMIFSIVTPIYIVKRVHEKDYPHLKRLNHVSLVKSIWNSTKASLIYLALWMVSLPLFLFPPLFLLVSHLLTSYLNAKVFSYDVLAEFMPQDRIRFFRKKYRGQFFSLGAISCLIFYVPVLNLIGIAYIALVFTHYGMQLASLENQGKNVAG